MSSSCLSAATIVRCATLSKLENGIVFIPVAVQIIFLVGLVFLDWGSGRKRHFMVLADGSMFYLITLLDLLSHLLPTARNNLQSFETFDIVIGSLSFVPVLLYTSFLFLFARSYFLPLLPRVPRVIAKYALLALIPIAIAMTELGSFLGISHILLDTQGQSEGQSYLAIGFKNSAHRTLWEGLTSVSLVLLIIVQAFTFFFSLYITISLIQERRLDRSLFEGYDRPTLRGISWIAVGAKLGAIESVLGFVSGGFSVVFTRRLLRMLSRCCLAVGALQSDGATTSRTVGHRRSRTMSQIRAMISNPRTSTFARLSPTAEEFYAIPRAVDNTTRQMREQQFIEGSSSGPIPRPQRVTVHYDGRSPPSLDLRLSDLNVPPAEILTAAFEKRGTIILDASYERRRTTEESRKSSSRSLTRSLSAIASPSAPMIDVPTLPQELRAVLGSRNHSADALGGLGLSTRPNPKFTSIEQQRQSNGTNSLFSDGHRRFMSASSLASDSLSVVNNLASQFPGIPPRRTASGRRSSYHEFQTHSTVLDGVEEVTEKETIKSGMSSRTSSVKRKPPPRIAGGLNEKAMSEKLDLVRADSGQSDDSNLSQSSSFRRKGMTIPPPIDSSIAGPDVSMAVRAENGTPASTAHSVGRRSEHVPDYKYSSMQTASTSATEQTPGMTRTSDNSPTDPETDIATVRDGEAMIDPFADSADEDGQEHPDYRVSELAMAESGLNRVATRLAEYDRQRRQSYRGAPQPSPDKFNVPSSQPRSRERERKNKEKQVEDDWDMVEFPSVNESLGVPISRPRRLSANSTGSASSLQNATATSGRRVTVSARLGPKYSDATILHAPFAAHVHTTSTSSAQTRASHNERELMRIKSVGRVATRRTPTPTPSTGSFATRQSMRIDSVDFSDGTDSPSPSPFRPRPLHESATSMSGVRSALREGWKAESDDDDDDISDRFRSRAHSGVHQDNDWDA